MIQIPNRGEDRPFSTSTPSRKERVSTERNTKTGDAVCSRNVATLFKVQENQSLVFSAVEALHGSRCALSLRGFQLRSARMERVLSALEFYEGRVLLTRVRVDFPWLGSTRNSAERSRQLRCLRSNRMIVGAPESSKIFFLSGWNV